MNDVLWPNAIITNYDGIKNETKETLLGPAIISASLQDIDFNWLKHNWHKLGLWTNHTNGKNSEVCVVGAYRKFIGKECVDDTEVSFFMGYFQSMPEDMKTYDTFVLEVDGERLEVSAYSREEHNDHHNLAEWCDCGEYEDRNIYLNKDPEQFITSFDMCYLRVAEFSLKASDIKKIADAKDVVLYVDSTEPLNVNGGSVNVSNTNDSVTVEGIQGLMKRVYNSFFDETYCIEYCVDYYETYHNITNKKEENDRQKREKEKKEYEKEQKELVDSWYRQRNISIIILLIGVILFVIGRIFDSVGFWFTWLPALAVFYAIIKLKLLYERDDSKDDGAQQNV